jgi:hypothetical protein
MKRLVVGLPEMVNSSVWNTRTKMDVLGMKRVVVGLPKMVTSSVWNTRTKTDVLGMERLVLLLPKMVTSSVWNTRTKTSVLGVRVMRIICNSFNEYILHEWIETKPLFFVCAPKYSQSQIIVITKDTPFPLKEEKRVAFVLPFFLSFFLSLCLCEWWCRRHEQKLQRHARGDARVRGTVEVLLPRKRTGFEILRDRFALVERERRDDETRPGRVHDEETTVLEMQTRTNGHANAHTRK